MKKGGSRKKSIQVEKHLGFIFFTLHKLSFPPVVPQSYLMLCDLLIKWTSLDLLAVNLGRHLVVASLSSSK